MIPKEKKHNVMPGQILPIKPGESMKIELIADGRPFIRVVATGSDTHLKNYNAGTEYWFTGDLSRLPLLDRGTRVDMTIQSGDFDDTNLDHFVGDFTKVAHWSEAPPFYGWRQPSYTAPLSTTPYLFWTTDPDVSDMQRPLGLSLIIGRDNRLMSVGWHKTLCPSNGYIWRSAPLPGLEFRLADWTLEVWVAYPNWPMAKWWYVVNQVGSL